MRRRLHTRGVGCLDTDSRFAIRDSPFAIRSYSHAIRFLAAARTRVCLPTFSACVSHRKCNTLTQRGCARADLRFANPKRAFTPCLSEEKRRERENEACEACVIQLPAFVELSSRVGARQIRDSRIDHCESRTANRASLSSSPVLHPQGMGGWALS